MYYIYRYPTLARIVLIPLPTIFRLRVILWANIRILEGTSLEDSARVYTDGVERGVCVLRNIDSRQPHRAYSAVRALTGVTNYCFLVGIPESDRVGAAGLNDDHPWWTSFLASLAIRSIAEIVQDSPKCRRLLLRNLGYWRAACQSHEFPNQVILRELRALEHTLEPNLFDACHTWQLTRCHCLGTHAG
jgi:hypothetical protein